MVVGRRALAARLVGRYQALEAGHVQRDLSATAQSHPVVVDFEHFAIGNSIQTRLELPQALAQVFSRLGRRSLPPQDGRKRLARVGTAAIQDEVGEELLHLARFEPGYWLPLELDREPAKQLYVQHRHGAYPLG
jgi:hypothetical protein